MGVSLVNGTPMGAGQGLHQIKSHPVGDRYALPLQVIARY